MRGRWWMLPATGLFLGLIGCVTVTAPERVTVGGGSRAEPVDSSRVPATNSHEEARAELGKAYRYIHDLEQRNARLDRKAKEYKRERDQCEDRLEKYEDD